MKNVLFSMILFLLIVSCSNFNDSLDIESKTSLNDYKSLNNNLSKSFSGLFDDPENFNFVKLIDKNEKKSIISIDINTNSTKIRKELIDNYFTNLNCIKEDISFSEVYKKDHTLRLSENNVDSYIEDIGQYSEEYKSEMKYFIESIQNGEIEDIPASINNFNNKIYASQSLSNEEKVQRITFSALTNSFSTFVKEGGLDDVQSSIIQEIGGTPISNGRTTASCKVSWRDAFRSGVEGFVVGAIRGAYVGATVGTVTVIGIGTVTGAVSGAVVSGAVGFAGA